MPVIQEIRTKTGKIKKAKLTPLRAIRINCLGCAEWKPREVDQCGGIHCPFYPYRHGKDPSRQSVGKTETLH